MAVPRDIDSACADLEGVTLCDIDDLQAVVARNISTREGDVPRAEQIVEQAHPRSLPESAPRRDPQALAIADSGTT